MPGPVHVVFSDPYSGVVPGRNDLPFLPRHCHAVHHWLLLPWYARADAAAHMVPVHQDDFLAGCRCDFSVGCDRVISYAVRSGRYSRRDEEHAVIAFITMKDLTLS